MLYRWNEGKNEILIRERGVSFEDVVDVLATEGVLDNYKHPQTDKYPNQYIYVISLHDYVHYVPYVTGEDYIFLKNIIPSRKLHKKYKGA
jgi:uncharacterized DUF497 family protein